MKTETVELPSGRKVTIRQPGPRGMTLIIGTLPTSMLLGDDQEKPSTSEALESFRKMSKVERGEVADTQMAIVCSCSVEPRFTTTIPAPQGYTDIDDLEYPDYVALRDACLTLINESKQEAAEKVGPLAVTPTA